MNEHTKAFLAITRENPLFKDMVNEFRKLGPVVPKYTPQASTEANEQLLERIKFESGRKEGFDLLLLFLTGEKNG